MADAPTAFEARADKSLLIVDDDRPFSTRLARAMEGRGYAVRVAESVADGMVKPLVESGWESFGAGDHTRCTFRGCFQGSQRASKMSAPGVGRARCGRQVEST